MKDHPDGKMDKTTFVELMSQERFRNKISQPF